MKKITVFLMMIGQLLVMATVMANEVNVNTASAIDIATQLKGVGLSKAEAIVDYRETHGDFESADDLALVKGIGLRTVDINREKIKTEVDQDN